MQPNLPSSLTSQIVADWYKHKQVVILGGAGFVGQQLARLLLRAGAHVLVIDDFSRGKTRIDGVTYVKQDVGASKISDLEFHLEKKHAVFNLTAHVAGVLYNQEYHTGMYYYNMRVLSTPVMAAELAGVPAFLQTSSVCVYAPEHNNPSTEIYGRHGTPHPANAGYAESKRDGERMALWSDIKNVVVVRPSNIAGPGDYYDDRAHVIPALIKRAFEKENPFLLYGDPYATREFIHPADVASGMMYALSFGEHREAYNIGCNKNNTISMNDLALQITDMADHRVPIAVDHRVGGGDSHRWSDAAKLNQLGWKFHYTLDDILEQSIEDYKERFM